ncbi:hypothetical protein Goari_021326 [Gossypium aridum]|uniref:Uncharacterized protein n=1 Tax=Gossypium aridum TaxID=34290 RepID=A0A7J8YDZ0_GOSAI|nr:hypothetical protein [Gossypium aridum]
MPGRPSQLIENYLRKAGFLARSQYRLGVQVGPETH